MDQNDSSTGPLAPSRDELVRQLEDAKASLGACMGGVDPQGAILAAKRITGLRDALRDTPAIIAHFAEVLRG